MLRRLFDALRGRRAAAGGWRVGGLYAIPREGGGYRIAKLLACDAQVVHLKLYGRHFPSVPQRLAPGDLEEGIDLDAILAGADAALAVAHLPMDARGFAASNPHWIQDAPVTGNERAAMHAALDGAPGDRAAAAARAAPESGDGRA